MKMWTIHVSIGNCSREPESIRRDQMAKLAVKTMVAEARITSLVSLVCIAWVKEKKKVGLDVN